MAEKKTPLEMPTTLTDIDEAREASKHAGKISKEVLKAIEDLEQMRKTKKALTIALPGDTREKMQDASRTFKSRLRGASDKCEPPIACLVMSENLRKKILRVWECNTEEATKRKKSLEDKEKRYQKEKPPIEVKIRSLGEDVPQLTILPTEHKISHFTQVGEEIEIEVDAVWIDKDLKDKGFTVTLK